MANSCFAFAPNKGFVFITPKQFKWANISAELEKEFNDCQPQELLWAAFGPEENNFFVSYVDKDECHRVVWGGGMPQILIDWINEGYDRHIRVSLGPNGSFFAWTSSRVRWHNIPDGLQKSIQSWLSPTGWSSGPPRIVSLGPQGCYFALSEYGFAAWSFPTSLLSKSTEMKSLKSQIEANRSTLVDTEVLSLSSSELGIWLWVKKDLTSTGRIWNWEPFDSVLDTLFDEKSAQRRRQKRQQDKAEAEATKKAQEEEAQAKAKKEQEAREARSKAAEEQRRREKEEEDEELLLQYYLWQTACEDDILKKKVLTTFPHLPNSVLFCKDISCKAFKEEQGSLRACQHDVERFFRASRVYDYAWLKKQRLAWHPDRFGQRCDPDYRKELQRKAEQLFQILEMLIERESGG